MPETARGTSIGVALSLGASALFGLIFLFSGWVHAPAEVVLAWRVVITFGCYALLLLGQPGRRALTEYSSVVRSIRGGPLLVIALALMVSSQLWVFVWAPAHGMALDASLGFLLLPITLALGGRFIFHEPISRVQWVAIVVACLAVTLKVLLVAEFSWVTALICFGYPVYFMTRRHTGLGHRAGFGVEMALLTPVMVLLLLTTPAGSPALATIAGVGIIAFSGAAAMAAYLGASTRLSLPVFGLLSYVEPLLLVAVSLLLGESLTASDYWIYGLLAVSLGILGMDAMRAVWHSRGLRNT
ncbi:permease [Glutamicibacter sp. PS]|uniref:EamA family transporter n=1 Tax=Glutamicibacter sp. PS TaxID=3075634 RepID=UPI00284EAD7B|nr:permease [Glutamicibacter sp. PS]MDR4534105.1 permease [Glutamicibacter sp. PS]